MNKDVIYIEPEDDITDIIAKIEKAKEKIVALVPPKKAGVFRSIVNIKLMAKAATAAKKTVVLVTTDPSITKLAAVTKLPVTKDLQSAPSVPTLKGDENSETTKEEVVDEEMIEETSEEETEDRSEEKEATNKTKDDDKDDVPLDGKEEKKTVEDKKDKKAIIKKTGNKFFTWIKEHKKVSIACVGAFVVFIILLVWMFVISPAVTLTVDIKTTQNNFSESVTFTTTLEEEKIEEGKFYLEEKKVESVEEKEFEATGSKNVGQKASGDVVIYAFFKNEGTIAINAGSTFKINDLTYVSQEDTSLSYDGNGFSKCDNEHNSSQIMNSGCQISGRVAVVATAPGSNYNIAASNSGWSTTANVGVYSDKAMTGGTDEMITIVAQSDIDKAKEELDTVNEADNKEKLYKLIDDTTMAIDSSFVQKASDAVSTPAVGEEVKSGEKATIKVTTTATIYVVDKTKIEEFIREKAKLEESQKIYEIKSPFIENFMKSESGYVGKLKTSYAVGPKVTENDIIEAVKGKGLGEAQHDLRDIDGITSVKIDKSFPWVMSVPGDVNKITVNLEIKE